MLSRCRKLFCTLIDDKEFRYIPTEPLKFVNGRSPLFLNDNFIVSRATFALLGAICGYGSYYSAKKLYHFSERTWLGAISYATLTIALINRMYKFNTVYMQIAAQLDLLQCGRKVALQHPSRFFILRETVFDIADIQRPKVVDKSIYSMSQAFPVLFQGQLFYFARDKDNILNKELLPVVMNGKHIATS